MYVGKTLFAQVMDFLPLKTFHRIVARYGGDHRVRTLSCAGQFRIMAFAQLTYRESLRAIESCLAVQAAKLYHMGIRELVACATLAAVKLHTLLDLRGAIPSFIHISDGLLHDVNVLDILVAEPGAFYVMDRAYLDFGRLHCLHQAGSFFVTRAKSNLNARREYWAPTNRAAGVVCDQVIALNGKSVSRDYPTHLRHIRFRDPDSGQTLVFLTNQMTLPALTICALYKARWQVELFFKWIKSSICESSASMALPRMR